MIDCKMNGFAIGLNACFYTKRDAGILADQIP